MSKQHLSPNIAVSLLQVRSICLHVRALTSSSTCLYKITSTERSPLHRKITSLITFSIEIKEMLFQIWYVQFIWKVAKVLVGGSSISQKFDVKYISEKSHAIVIQFQANMSNQKMAVIYLICAVFKTRNSGSLFFFAIQTQIA